MRLFFEITDDRPPDVGKNKFREFSRNGMAEVGTLYDNTFKMRHFEEGARSRYGYRPRSAAYVARKAKAVARNSFSISPDANRDLIYKGPLRQAVRQRHFPNAFPTRVTVNMPTPSYAQMTPRRSNMPNLGDELTRVAADELVQMHKAYQDSVEHDLNTFREKRTTIIG